MGIVYPLVEALVREHAYKRLDGDIVLIGRQGVTLVDVKSGHLFMANDFVPRDPLSEIRKVAVSP